MNTKKRILVVDDEQINLEFFEVMLSKLGFDVHLAENGQQALESVRRLHPDLVILDNIMPKLSGWEVTKILKSSPEYSDFADTPIIMFSALDDVKDKVEGLELGAEDYITKPFNFAEVLARIRAVLRSHELLNQLDNREKRLNLGETTVTELSSAVSRIKQVLQSIEKADDLEAARKHAAQGLGILKELDPRLLALKNESDDLRKSATDLVRHASKKEPL